MKPPPPSPAPPSPPGPSQEGLPVEATPCGAVFPTALGSPADEVQDLHREAPDVAAAARDRLFGAPRQVSGRRGVAGPPPQGPQPLGAARAL